MVGFAHESGVGKSRHRVVAALEAALGLVLSGQQVAPNSQNESREVRGG